MIWLAGMIVQRSQRQLAAWSVVFLVAGMGAVLQSDYFRACIHGPVTMNIVSLDAIETLPSPAPFVKVEGERLVDTGLVEEHVTTRHGRETGRQRLRVFALLMADGRLLLMEPAKRSSLVAEGALRRPSRKLSAALQEGISHGITQLERAYPFVLDTTSYRSAAELQLGMLGMLIVVFLLLGVPQIRALRDPLSRKVFQRLLQRGNARSISDAVEEDYKRPRLASNELCIGKHFIMRVTFFAIDVWSLEDLIWGYGQVTRHYVNFIPTGRSYGVVFHLYGGTLTCKRAEYEVPKLLEAASKVAPWALFGFSRELLTQWNKDPRFVAAQVQQRKAWRGMAPPRKPKLPKGADAKTRLTVTRSEAASGCDKQVPYRYPLACARCRGSGLDVKSYHDCVECKGSGEVHREGSLRVTVPPGIHGDQVLRVPNKGVPSSDGTTAGDLYIEVHITGLNMDDLSL